jgi:hypothetical protein
MTDRAPTFELVLTGNTDPHQFTASTPDGEGGRAAEHTLLVAHRLHSPGPRPRRAGTCPACGAGGGGLCPQPLAAAV